MMDTSPEVFEIIMELGLMIEQVVSGITCVKQTSTTICSKT